MYGVPVPATLYSSILTQGFGINQRLITQGYFSGPSKTLDILRQIIANMEKRSIGDFVFLAGCVEPGIDNANTPIRRILEKLE